MFEWHAALGIFAALLQIFSIVPYVRETLKGTVRPNLVSQFLWTILQMIAIAAQLSAGASWSVLLLIGMTFNTILLMILALVGYGYKKYSWIEGVCLACGILAIVLWQITGEPAVALVLSLAATIAASVPTVVKAYRDPETESARAWSIMFVASILAAVSTTRLDFANLLFPIYFIFESGTIGGLAFFRRRR